MALSFAERLERDIADRAPDDEIKTQLAAWLKADKDFNLWFLATTKRALRDEELSALLDGYQHAQEIVETAWKALEKSAHAKGIFTGERAATKALLDAVAQSLDELQKLQGSI